jgi:hypothetical protein
MYVTAKGGKLQIFHPTAISFLIILFADSLIANPPTSRVLRLVYR